MQSVFFDKFANISNQDLYLMNSIRSTNYSVHFSEEGYTKLNALLKEKALETIYVLVDDNTYRHCFPYFSKKVEKNVKIELIKIKAGEQHKNISTCIEVWKKLTDLKADRKSLLINLGGGMVSDLGGFVASTYKRGINFINVPTTILSMVDASVGSKTGVDLDNLKNLIGVFSDPLMVLIDTHYLTSLSARETRSGIAEVIKYGLTFDSELLNEVINDKWLTLNNLNDLIYKSILIKNKVVLQDIKEENLRKVLNFGHTVGHAIESFYLDNKNLDNLTHGEAIAMGMVIEAYMSYKLYQFPISTLSSLKQYIHKLYGKVQLAENNYPAIIDLMKHDKKNRNGHINYILLKDIAVFEIDIKAPTDLVKEGMNYYNS